MKCIKEVKTGKIVRVTDKEAEFAVRDGKWGYCSKSEWKKGRVK